MRQIIYIDIHSGDDYEELTPYIYYAGRADADVSVMSRKMAEQADVPYMVKSDVASGGSYNYAASCGIPKCADRDEARWVDGHRRKFIPQEKTFTTFSAGLAFIMN